MVRKTRKRWVALLLAGVLSVSMLDTGAYVMKAQASEIGQQEGQAEIEGISVEGTESNTDEAAVSKTEPEDAFDEEAVKPEASDEVVLESEPQEIAGEAVLGDEEQDAVVTDVEVLDTASDNQQSELYSAVLLSDEEWQRFVEEGELSESVTDERWTNVASIGAIFAREDDDWKGLWSAFPNLVIQPNSEGESDSRERVESNDIVIPDGFKHVWFKNWNGMVFEFKGAVTVPDNGELFLEGDFNGDVEIKAGEQASVTLLRANIGGILRTDSETCALTVMRDDSMVGGLEGFHDVTLFNNLYTTGKAEFWDLHTGSDTRMLLVEGDSYAEEKAPVFHKRPHDRATDRPWILTSKEKQQLYQITDEQNPDHKEYYIYDADTERYVWVWLEESNGGKTARREDGAGELTQQQADENKLEAVADTQVYVSRQYERYEGWNDVEDGNGGNDHRQSEYVKIGDDYYRIVANSGYEENPEDDEAQKANGALAKETDSDIIADIPNTMADDLGDGYQLEQRFGAALSVRWIKTRSEADNWEWNDVPLKEGVKVISFADDMHDAEIVQALEWQQFDLDTGYESDEADYIRRNGNRYLISLDGCVYYEEHLIYGAAGIDAKDWEARMQGDHNFESFDWIGGNPYPTMELALRAIKAIGHSYACLLIGNPDMYRQFTSEVTLDSLTVPDGVTGLSVMTRGWRVKGLSEINIPEGKTLVLQEFIEGSDQENDKDADTIEVTGGGRLILREAVLNANVNVKKASENSGLDIRIFNDNAVKSLTSECLIDFEDGRLAVEDFFDTSASSITGRPELAGRYDAVIRFGEIHTMIDETYGTDDLRVISESKDGKNTTVEMTSSDIQLGKVRQNYSVSVSGNELSYPVWYLEQEESEEQPHVWKEYVDIDGQYYQIDWDKEEALSTDGRPTLEAAINAGLLTLVGAKPEGVQEKSWDASIVVRVLDAEKESRFSVASIYDPNGWTNDPGQEGENGQWVEGDFKKNIDWNGNLVHVSNTGDICLAVVTAEDLPFTDNTDSKELNDKIQAFYGLIRGEFNSSEEGKAESDDWTQPLECMAPHIAETTDEGSDFYGKQACREGIVNGYNMFYWNDGEEVAQQDRVQVDTHKYVAVLTDLSGAQIAPIADQTETGSALTPALTVKLDGETLVENRDYTAEYKDNVKGGTATVTITGIAPFGGTKSASFTIRHVEGDWIETKAATQAETGTKVLKCKICGEEIDSGVIDKLPADAPKTDEQKTADGKADEATTQHTTHTPGDWTVEKDATADAAGLKVRRCTVCGEIVESQEIPKYTVTLNVSSIPLKVKQSTTALKATVLDGDSVASWTSSNKKVATVTSKGKVTGKKKGTATITVTTKKGATAKCKVTVQTTDVKIKKIKADVKTLSLKVKKTYKLTVTKTPLTATDKVTYTTSDKKVATVDKNGKITAKKAGKATITIKCGSRKATVKVTVKK